MDFDQISHFEVSRIFEGPSCVCFQAFILATIKFSVFAVSLEVIPTLFTKRDSEYEGQRCYVGEQETNFQLWDKLAQRNEQEKQVIEKLELVVEYYWEKRKEVVLLVAHSVAHKGTWLGNSV